MNMHYGKLTTTLLCAGVLGAAAIGWDSNATKPTGAIAAPEPTPAAAIDPHGVDPHAVTPNVVAPSVADPHSNAPPVGVHPGADAEGCPYAGAEGAAYDPSVHPMPPDAVVYHDDPSHPGIIAVHESWTAGSGGSANVEAVAMHGSQRPQVAAPAAGEIEPAEGPHAATIQALHTGTWHGGTARVRGRVVRVVEGVMGTNFVHLRDGTGSDANGNADLTVTMHTPPELGETLTVEGSLVADHEVGTGYVYRVLLKDAARVR